MHRRKSMSSRCGAVAAPKTKSLSPLHLPRPIAAACAKARKYRTQDSSVEP
jgi:hypothetical protein